ncbi:hypothetical protein ASG47_09700 [Devosia sp. Leaf420]|uniref:hypothetical protein n=1 Tax=Devosia sp. Leaf420 TaxID=1736374 RepID=UPI000713EE42|nr:hypothetical protein [Devosia sp. Leaf420]KQT46883.1 hypothetical protein ASG47_09700 [Devosia sp. Leaf420]
MVGTNGLGLALKSRSGARAASGPWLDADFVVGQYGFAGRSFSDPAQFRLAAGGTVAPTGHLFLGPNVAPDAQELLADGNFSAGTATDWTGVGGSVAIASGALRVTGAGGSGSGAFRTIAGLINSSGRAYRLTGSVWRGTASSVTLGFGAGGGGTANYAQTANLTNTVPEAAALYCGGFSVGTASIAVRHQVNPATGTYFADDLSLKEALPYAGFRPGNLCGIIGATTPASGGTGGIVLQADDNAEFNANWFERNFIRIIWDASLHLRLIVSFGGTGSQVEQANIDLGAVPAGSSFAVAFSARDGEYRAAFIGQPAQKALAGTFPGLAAIRLGRGRSAVTGLWTGSISRIRLYPYALNEEAFAAFSSGEGIAAWGDSLTAGAGATGGSTGAATYPAIAQTLFSPPRIVHRQGQGGQTSTQIAARMNAVPILVTVAGGAIPASGPVAVTDKSVNVLYNSGAYTGAQRGWLAGVDGVMTTDASGNWTFTRSQAGMAVAAPASSRFTCAWGLYLKPFEAWLWLGRNGAQSGRTVAQDIDAAVKSLGHNRYLVGGILPSAADSAPALTAQASLNGQLASLYGVRFVNLLAALVAGANGSPEDSADVAAGYVPRSLRSDHLHLNDGGYARVAAAFHGAHQAMGW